MTTKNDWARRDFLRVLAASPLLPVASGLDSPDQPRPIRSIDEVAFDLICRGEIAEVRSLDDGGCLIETIHRIAPKSIEEVAATIALGRPSVIRLVRVEAFIRGRAGVDTAPWSQPTISPLLAETYGLVLYGEQIVQIGFSVAGMSLVECDLMRKAMGMKLTNDLASLRVRFVEGARRNGFTSRDARETFDLLNYQACFQFSRTFAHSQALKIYSSAYLQALHFGEHKQVRGPAR